MSFAVKFTNPDAQFYQDHLRYSAELVKSGRCVMIDKNRHRSDKGVVICSTGPTIMHRAVLDEVRRLHVEDGLDVIALKEAIPWIKEQCGIPIRYSVSMDPGGERQVARTPIDNDVIYLVASTCNPVLLDHLLDHGCRVHIFHNACGYKEAQTVSGFYIDLKEDGAIVSGKFELKTLKGRSFCPIATAMLTEADVYVRDFPSGDIMQGGFTVTNRAIAVCKYFGYPRVVCAGTDFGWRDEGRISHYADIVKVEPTPAAILCDEGKIDGKKWYSKPDQLASAVQLAKEARRGEMEFIGDVLPKAMADHASDDYLDRIVKYSTTKRHQQQAA